MRSIILNGATLALLSGAIFSCSSVMKEEEEYNIRFLKSVERHRCVYDFSLLDYSDKEVQEEAWIDIAEEMNSTAADCKERWRNLRGSLTRHLKNQTRVRNAKPYYLKEHMQFIVPFTKTRSRSVLPLLQNHNVTSEDLKMLADDDEDEGLELMQPPPNVLPMRKRSRSPDGESLESFLKFKRPREDFSDADPDINFFISLLPDVRSMDASQKRQMKIGILKIIDDLLT